jgi:hypothetical protein
MHRLRLIIISPGLLILFQFCNNSSAGKIQNKVNMNINFSASFCDPLNPNIIQLGDISKEQVVDEFEKINWTEYLQKMNNAKENEIYYSPSFEVHNKDTKHGLAISAVGDPSNYEFYIFYKRPKKVKSLFGLKEKLDENYTSDTTGQTKQNVIDCLNALIRNDTIYLANKIGE